MSDIEHAPATARRRNWWKIAFFVTLFLFECAREAAVLAGLRGAVPNGTAIVSSYGGLTSAKGRWTRIDGGGRLMTAVVTIDCRQDIGQCVEASSMISDEYVYSPEIEWFDAKFAEDAITFENDVPDCARYSVRIDLKLKKTFAVRERKGNPKNPNCTKLEPRVEMQMGDPYEADRKLGEGYFVPVFSMIRTVVN